MQHPLACIPEKFLQPPGWLETFEDSSTNQSCPSIGGNRCRAECLLPVQFGLPCQCFLYHCLVEQKAIPMSLIHPRLSHAQFEMRAWKIIDRRQFFLTTYLGSIMNRTSFEILMISIQVSIPPGAPFAIDFIKPRVVRKSTTPHHCTYNSNLTRYAKEKILSTRKTRFTVEAQAKADNKARKEASSI